VATTLATMRQRVRGFYGLTYSASEDPLYVDSFLNLLIDRVYQEFIGIVRPLEHNALSIAVTSGTAAYDLDGNSQSQVVLEPKITTFRYQLSSTYTRLAHQSFESLLETRGPLESVTSATPTQFYLQGGNTTTPSAKKKVVLVPTPNANATLHFGAWIYGAALTSDSDNLQLADPDCYRLISGCCFELARFDLARGRPGAAELAQFWWQAKVQDLSEMHRIVRNMTREFPTGPQVLQSPLAAAMERMRPPLIAGAGVPG